MTDSLIILEGPDGAGKTTLARALTESLSPVNRVAHGPPKEDPMREYLPALLMGGTVIADRFHLGERVYGGIVRGDDRLGNEGQYLLESIIASSVQSAVVVLCRPPLETCLENWRSRLGDEYVKREDWMTEVWHAYGRVQTRLPTYRYDYTQTGLAEAVEAIHAYIK